MKYLIYCRKSTDTEDKQTQSLESQETEMRRLAEGHNLHVVGVLTESMSAKAEGRPVFNEMLNTIARGEADGIICWKLDRLARNMLDGGKIIDLLQRSVIKEIRTIESIHLPTDNVFMMAIHFSSANQYVRDLSVNVKRGNRTKLERGEWPNHAPIGYLNKDKKIVVDPKRAKYIVRIFELYASGSYSCTDITEIIYNEGFRQRSGTKVYRSNIERIIKSKFYLGLMERDGKIYEGKHTPLISQKLFDTAQDVASNRSRPRPQRLFFPLRGFLSCESCGCAFTASLKKGHHYYYCTNGRKKCTEHKSYLRENYLYEEVAKKLESLAFDEEEIELMYESAKEKSSNDTAYLQEALDTLNLSLQSLTEKESRLLDTFLAEQISKDLYDKKILDLQNEKTSLKKQIKDLKLKQPASTLEPIKNVFIQANKSRKEFLEADDQGKRIVLEKLLWNLSIKEKNILTVKYKSPFEVIAKSPKNGSFAEMLPR